MRKANWFILLLLFYLSGTSGLIYEILWVRIFSLVFGNTTYAATIVLSAFFSGMAVGSIFFGRRAEQVAKPFRVYGFLELGIGLSALAVPFLVKTMDGFYPFLYLGLGEQTIPFSLVRFALSFIIVFIPTFLMGGTLPLLVKFTSLLREEFGKSVSLLYAFNTFGGVTGAFLSGFLLVRYLGINHTLAAAVAINIIVGVTALLLSRQFQPSEKLTPAPEMSSAISTDSQVVVGNLEKLILLVAFFTGLFSLAFEVVWARLLVYVLSSSVYAFSIMLTTFLFGIALGSLIARWIIPRIRQLGQLCGLLISLTGVYGFVTIPLLVFLAQQDEAIISLFGFASWPRYNVGRFAQSGLIIVVPTLLMGIVFPLIARIAKTMEKTESRVIGNVYFVNTLGAIIGSALGGFVLVPFLGCKWSIILLSAAYLCTGLTFLLLTCKNLTGRLLMVCFSCALIVTTPLLLRGNPFIPLFNIREQGSDITYIREGTTGTVTVHRYPSFKVININRVNVAGTSFVLRTTQKLQAFLPLFTRKDPKLVCQIGFGSGETSSIVVRYPGVERLDVVDISYEVFDAAPEFKGINHGLYNDSKVRKIVMDGKNYMHLTNETYDLIMNDSIHPVECGNASLYTKEYFEDCKRHLKDGGVMSSWFPLFALDSRDFKSLIRTFNDVFPGCTLWVGNNCVNRHALLVGRKDGNEVTIDFNFIHAALQQKWISRELAEIRMYNVYDVIDSFMLNGKAVSEFTAGADINTDYFPILEYRSPTTVATDAASLAGNISDLLRMRSNVFYNLCNVTAEDANAVRAKLDKFMESTAYLLQGHINSILENYPQVVPYYEKAAALNPFDHDGKNLVDELRNLEAALSATVARGGGTAKELNDLGVVSLELGNLPKAKHFFELLLQREPTNRTGLYLLFTIYQVLEDEKGQRTIIDRLIPIEKNPEVFFQKGLMLGGEGNYRESVKYFEKAIGGKAKDPKYYFYLGLSLESLGDTAQNRDQQWEYYSKAMKQYEQTKSLDKENEFPAGEHLNSLRKKLAIPD